MSQLMKEFLPKPQLRCVSQSIRKELRLPRVTWTHAHTEDDLAVARHGSKVARVFHNGTDYSFEVMTLRWWSQARAGLWYDVIADGTRTTHSEAMEAARDHLVGTCAQ